MTFPMGDGKPWKVFGWTTSGIQGESPNRSWNVQHIPGADIRPPDSKPKEKRRKLSFGPGEEHEPWVGLSLMPIQRSIN
jgi:hypothetical protein